MKRAFLFLLMTATGIGAFAQINVYSNNYVGVGSAATSANSPLSINTTGLSSYAVSVCPQASTTSGGVYIYNSLNSTNFYGLNSTSANANAILHSVWGYAAISTAQSTGQAYGVAGIAGNCTNGYNFGVYGQLQGSNTGAAVYGNVGSGIAYLPSDKQWAGYFGGDTKVTGTLWVSSTSYTSDKRLKKNIASIDSVTTNNIYLLQPVKYKFLSMKELSDSLKPSSDTAKISVLANTPDPDYVKKLHYGFLAQDLQKVYPDLVYTSGDGTMGIDYQGLIPLIIEQMIKMKQSLDDKEARIEALEKTVKQLQKGKQ